MPGWGRRNEQGERFVVIPGFFLGRRGVVTLGFCVPRLKGQPSVGVFVHSAVPLPF